MRWSTRGTPVPFTTIPTNAPNVDPIVSRVLGADPGSTATIVITRVPGTVVIRIVTALRGPTMVTESTGITTIIITIIIIIGIMAIIMDIIRETNTIIITTITALIMIIRVDATITHSITIIIDTIGLITKVFNSELKTNTQASHSNEN